MTDCRRRSERAIEMDAVDEGVDAEDFQAVALRLDDRRIVADTDRKPGRGGGKPSADAGDELAFGQIGGERLGVGGQGFGSRLGGLVPDARLSPSLLIWHSPPHASRE